MLVTDYADCCASIANEVISWLHDRLFTSDCNDDLVTIDDRDYVDVLDCSSAVVLPRGSD